MVRDSEKKEICRSLRFSKGWVTFGKYLGWNGTFPTIPVGVERLEISYPCFVWCWDIDRRLFHFHNTHV